MNLGSSASLQVLYQGAQSAPRAALSVSTLPNGITAAFDTTEPNAPPLPLTTTIAGQPNKVHYFTYQGDTNLGGPQDNSGFGIINCNQDPCDGFNSLVAKTLYGTMQSWNAVGKTTDSSGRVVAIPLQASRPYDGNDLIVTVKSATFQAPFSSLGTLKVNHTTIGYSNIGQQIAQFMVSNYRQLQGN